MVKNIDFEDLLREILAESTCFYAAQMLNCVNVWLKVLPEKWRACSAQVCLDK